MDKIAALHLQMKREGAIRDALGKNAVRAARMYGYNSSVAHAYRMAWGQRSRIVRQMLKEWNMLFHGWIKEQE